MARTLRQAHALPAAKRRRRAGRGRFSGGDVPRGDEVPILGGKEKELKALAAGTLRSRTRRLVLEKWDEMEG
jgi:hypothetical protein